MITLTPDQIGDMGQWMAAMDLSRPVGGKYRRPLFRPVFLGDKFPTTDFLVVALGRKQHPIGFFMAQIRSTSEPVVSPNRLRINVEKSRYNRLAEIPMPTYLIGVDITSEESYVVCVAEKRQRAVSSISTVHRLKNDSVRIALYLEIEANWSTHHGLPYETEFDND